MLNVIGIALSRLSPAGFVFCAAGVFMMLIFVLRSLADASSDTGDGDPDIDDSAG